MPESVKKTKCGGVAEKFEGVCRRGVKKTKCGGGVKSHTKIGGGSVENYVFLRGSNIK